MNTEKPPIVMFLDIDGVLNVEPYDFVYLKKYPGFEWRENAPVLNQLEVTHTPEGIKLPSPRYDYSEPERISEYFKPLPEDTKNEYFKADKEVVLENLDDTLYGSDKKYSVRIVYSTEMVEKIRELENSGLVEIVWFTTWMNNAPKFFAPAVEFGENSKHVFISPPGFRDRNYTQEKKRLMEYILSDENSKPGRQEWLEERYLDRLPEREIRPIIWVDDYATEYCAMRLKKGGDKELYWLDVRGLRYGLKDEHPNFKNRYQTKEDVLAIKTDGRYGITRKDLKAIEAFINKFKR